MAVLLALNGVHPKTMLELACHCNSQITMDIYTHYGSLQRLT